ncbi:MAG: protein-export chaperone SecB [Gemmatimonadota bacterium]
MNAPSTGYALEKIHTVRADYRPALEEEWDSHAEREISFLWDWRVTDDTNFSVVLGARIGPSETERDKIEAVVVGNFEIMGDVQSVDLRRFVELNAPALIMPYLRQALTSLSDQGPFGAFYLPPVNVKTLSEDFDTEAATGAIQLKEDPLLIGPASEKV